LSADCSDWVAHPESVRQRRIVVRIANQNWVDLYFMVIKPPQRKILSTLRAIHAKSGISRAGNRIPQKADA
jgi:hypothetical protein